MSKYTQMRNQPKRIRGGKMCACGTRVLVTRSRRGSTVIQPHICTAAEL